jgi:hypothetical protein
MAKTLTITVEDSENSENNAVYELVYDADTPDEGEWNDILKFEDDHVGGRPKDR